MKRERSANVRGSAAQRPSRPSDDPHQGCHLFAATAIAEARRYGLSIDAIGERMGVSRERVRQREKWASDESQPDTITGRPGGSGPRQRESRAQRRLQNLPVSGLLYA